MLSDLATEQGRISTDPEGTVTLKQSITTEADQEISATLTIARSRHTSVQEDVTCRDLTTNSYRERSIGSSYVHHRLLIDVAQDPFDPFAFNLKSNWGTLICD